MILYDSDVPEDIPANAAAVAGYAEDGEPGSWSAADWARFPQARLVIITRNPSVVPAPLYDGGTIVLDVERGAASVADIPAWLGRARNLQPKADLAVYLSSANWQSAVSLLAEAHIPPAGWWVAHWGAEPTVPVGAVALQYASAPGFDTSVTMDGWPAAAAATLSGVNVPPAPAPGDALTVAIKATKSGNGYWIIGQDGGVFAFGDAGEFPLNGVAGNGFSLPGCKITPTGPILGFDVTPTEQGYWMMDAIGGVYTFGDAGFHGSLPGQHVEP